MLPTPARAPLAAAAGCALSALVVWLTAYHLSPFEAIDQRTFDGFLGLSRPVTARWSEQISQLADPGPFALFAAALLIVALARRKLGTAATVAVILAGANLTTQLLKPALAKAPLVPGMETATWPSGHATAAMSLALCLPLVVPARLRPAAAAVGGLFAVAVVYAVLILGHHEPSDVLGGFLVAGTWAALGVAALRTAATDRTVGPPTAGSLYPAAVAAAALATAIGAVAIAHWHGALDYAAVHTTFMVAAAVLTLGAMGMAATAALALTRR